MRASPLLLALPALASAQQIPFMDQLNPYIEQLNPYIDQVKGYFGAAKSNVASTASSVLPAAPSVPNPVASAAAVFAATKVSRVTLDNYPSLLVPSTTTAGPEEWMLYVTGGNKSCFGLCEPAEIAWNQSVGLMSASSTPPKFALLDCDDQGVLCAAWAVSPPTVIHMLLPQPLPDQSKPATTVRSISLNRTTVAAPEIAAIHLQETYKDVAPYEGLWHPFDGPLAQYGVQIPVGWAMYGFSKIPSWAFMIGVSFISRSFMSRKMGAGQGPRAPGGTPAPAS
ncbi:hypothetical protein LTR91_024639 [Friedmanniomyces endolithicus]|uniref:Uncharacterized protein n=1 Tax=Friedmanniomyces endolithicus TaxID=329885 RepID=A0AAN6H3Y2_9PEZI|nr:hypothetical protein LTR35_013141 [Friedmanniomyces endolithicus]KAK0298418.1 hypothetical protein LTS00_002798 [Friedmanniomyces endolithicus]KAK0316532.1 hypothetical protein LTR01_000280 [Friedmanniomyces endolithicus]KAK0327739.1 hypothetical protein LTR82_001256 [Friedmanniomyces endolithicus]KAK0834708.1 hypothetical protein LTR73_000997 [Friedmanniomyces endolithicus]